MTTRWSDNDPYGHLNNVVYYELFDAAVNALLIEAGLLDPADESCHRAGRGEQLPVLRLARLSRRGRGRRPRSSSSAAPPSAIVLAVFRAGAPTAAAQGRYTHVYVERASGRPTPIPEGHRRLMEALAASGS